MLLHHPAERPKVMELLRADLNLLLSTDQLANIIINDVFLNCDGSIGQEPPSIDTYLK
jgi:hypothetical protein